MLILTRGPDRAEVYFTFWQGSEPNPTEPWTPVPVEPPTGHILPSYVGRRSPIKGGLHIFQNLFLSNVTKANIFTKIKKIEQQLGPFEFSVEVLPNFCGEFQVLNKTKNSSKCL